MTQLAPAHLVKNTGTTPSCTTSVCMGLDACALCSRQSYAGVWGPIAAAWVAASSDQAVATWLKAGIQPAASKDSQHAAHGTRCNRRHTWPRWSFTRLWGPGAPFVAWDVPQPAWPV